MQWRRQAGVPITYVGHRINDRNNNLDLLRLVAAVAVIVSHSFSLANGPGADEPLELATGKTLGEWAVRIFFVVSGLLIAASWERTRDPVAYVVSRGLRIFPGLAVACVVVTLIIGPFASSLTLGEYAGSPRTWRYLAVNTLALPGANFLPGVFEGNPFPAAVNGSLWTLFFELVMYVAVLALGMARLIQTPEGPRLRGAFVAAAALIVIVSFAGDHPAFILTGVLSLGPWFGMGVVLYLWRGVIPLHGGVAAIAVSVLGALALVAPSSSWWNPVALVCLPYLIVFLGLHERRPARTVEDVSYGMYIYAFPVQQLFVDLLPGIGPTTLTVLSIPLTAVLAVASHRLVELPALRLRSVVLRPRLAPA